MKAAVYTDYGPPEVLQLKGVVKPAPKVNEVLIKVHATAVSAGDWHVRKADPFIARVFFGLTKPKKQILGGVVAGEVEATGSEVKLFEKGDRVFGSTGMNFGAYAEYVCLPEAGLLTPKPDNISFEEAAAIPFGANTALHFLKKANITQGQKVLVYGASGAIGTAAVQLAKSYGAIVTGVCSTSNVELVRSLGADNVVDYTREDVAARGEYYDVLFDTVGKLPYSDALKVLKQDGTLLLASAGISETLRAAWTSMTSKRKAIAGVMSEKQEDALFIRDLVSNGKLKAVIDKVLPLEKIVEAHAYVEAGHKKGNVVITLGHT